MFTYYIQVCFDIIQMSCTQIGYQILFKKFTISDSFQVNLIFIFYFYGLMTGLP